MVQAVLAKTAEDLDNLPKKKKDIEEIQQQNPQLADRLLNELEGGLQSSKYSSEEVKSILGENPLPEAKETTQWVAGVAQRVKDLSAETRKAVHAAEEEAEVPEIKAKNQKVQELQKPYEEAIQDNNKVVQLLVGPKPKAKELRSVKNIRTVLVTSAELEDLRSACGPRHILQEDFFPGDLVIPKGSRLCKTKIMAKTAEGAAMMDILADSPEGFITGQVKFELPQSLPADPPLEMLSLLKQHMVDARREDLLMASYFWKTGPPSGLRLELQGQINSTDSRVEDRAAFIETTKTKYKSSAQTYLEQVRQAVSAKEERFLRFEGNISEVEALLEKCRDEKDDVEFDLTRIKKEAQDLWRQYVQKVAEYTRTKQRKEAKVLRVKQFEKMAAEAAAIRDKMSAMMAAAQVMQAELEAIVEEDIAATEKSCTGLREDCKVVARGLEKQEQVQQRALELMLEEADHQIETCGKKEQELMPEVEKLQAEFDQFDDEDVKKELGEKEDELKGVQTQKQQAEHMKAIGMALLALTPPKTQGHSQEIEDAARELYTPLKKKERRTSTNSDALMVLDERERQLKKKWDEENARLLATQELERRREIQQLNKRMDQLSMQLQQGPLLVAVADPESRSTTSAEDDDDKPRPVFLGAGPR